MAKKITLEEFVSRAKEVHGELYDYSHVVYRNMHTKVKIIDLEYGEFWQRPQPHLNGQGHPSRGSLTAANKRRTSVIEFIEQANIIHNHLYDYSKVVYIHCDSKVCIIDPKYGEFWQSPYQHLRSHGCPERTKNLEWLINQDHIVPLSCICTQNRSPFWVKNRPLYKFLNSEINLQSIMTKENKKKSDIIIINGKEIFAGNIRNNYSVIKYICQEKLGIDISAIIEDDEKYIKEYLFM